MATQHILRLDVIHEAAELRLSPSEYDMLKKARSVLSGALTLEETYELLIQNYLEFEQRLLLLAARSIVRPHRDHLEFFESITTMSVALSNLLSVARLYLDRLPQSLGVFAERGANISGVDKMRKDEHAANFKYRFMEELRNHVQHRGLPNPTVEFSSPWTSRTERGRMEYCVQMLIKRKQLEAAGGFKKSILDEMTEAIDAKAAVRQYLGSLSSIHCLARETIDSFVSDARGSWGRS